MDLINEYRDKNRIREETCKIQATKRYNSKVTPQSFREGDLVWHMWSEAQENKGKFLSSIVLSLWGFSTEKVLTRHFKITLIIIVSVMANILHTITRIRQLV